VEYRNQRRPAQICFVHLQDKDQTLPNSLLGQEESKTAPAFAYDRKPLRGSELRAHDRQLFYCG
jgi:hypothetical protein